MVYDQPNIGEVALMIDFCKSGQRLLVYGCQENQILLAKYLQMSGIQPDGFLITQRLHWEYEADDLPVYTLDELNQKDFAPEETSILLALPGRYYNEVLCRLQSMGYRKIFYMSEYNKNTIAYKMRPRRREQFWVEVNLADHCNLNCQMCDHFAPLARPTFADLDTFKRDAARLAELTDGKIGIFKLQGGEPLLNPQLIEFIKVTRFYFPKAVIFLFTDGLWLKKWENYDGKNLWCACHDYAVKIELTVYPIPLELEDIQALAKKYSVCVDCFSEAADRGYNGIKHSVKHPMRLEKDVDPWQFISCYQFNESITLRNGRLYTCPIIPYIEHFNAYFGTKLEARESDSIDIYSARSYDELSEFLTHRTDFCGYCNICARRAFEWKQSEHSIEEYVDLEEELS